MVKIQPVVIVVVKLCCRVSDVEFLEQTSKLIKATNRPLYHYSFISFQVYNMTDFIAYPRFTSTLKHWYEDTNTRYVIQH